MILISCINEFLNQDAVQTFLSKLSGNLAGLFVLDVLGFVEKKERTIDKYVDLFVDRLEIFLNET